ncbi:MAG: diaminopimelate epimerase [Sandaracinaceae bacterium]|nr:diaminopimelate epimerase [Sandaracinaceae bacterium]
MWQVPFSKYEGLGNDFILVDAAALGTNALDSAQAKLLCDRHRGVGADGVLVVSEASGTASMHIYNADGSEPEMCGNGLRCVALYLQQKKNASPNELVVNTPAGPHACRILGDGMSVEVEMRAPSFDPTTLPLASSLPWLDAKLSIDGLELTATALSVGNPHLVVFDALTSSQQQKLGPRLEVDPRFTRGVNVGFATIEGEGISLRVWERGVGFTEACGTGACAAAAAAVQTGRLLRERAIVVSLPGGDVSVFVGKEGAPLRMAGPARHVFDGVTTLADRA